MILRRQVLYIYKALTSFSWRLKSEDNRLKVPNDSTRTLKDWRLRLCSLCSLWSLEISVDWVRQELNILYTFWKSLLAGLNDREALIECARSKWSSIHWIFLLHLLNQSLYLGIVGIALWLQRRFHVCLQCGWGSSWGLAVGFRFFRFLFASSSLRRAPLATKWDFGE